jgi:hypothetical protein
VLERGDRAVAGKAALVGAGQLCGVERDGEDLAIADRDFDAPADQDGSSE